MRVVQSEIREPVPQRVGDIDLFIEGDVLYAAMLDSIAAASRSVRMESYIFAADEVGWRFAEALGERARAGIDVRLHLDAAGVRGAASTALQRSMMERGVHVKYFHRWVRRRPLRYNRRNHRKLLVIDEDLAYVGGFNIHRQSSREFYGARRWRDTHAAFTGTLAAEAAKVFDAFWRGHRRWLPTRSDTGAAALIPSSSRACQRRIHCLYSDAFASARERIYLSTPYFVPDLRTQRSLIEAARRGVDVRLLVPASSDVPIASWAAQAVYAVLLAAGVSIFRYVPRMLHTKTAVVDGSWAALGTANLDYRSFFLNYELVLALREPRLCAVLEQHFLADLAQSVPIAAQVWERRSWAQRLLESLGWALRRWL
ncbi:MAG: hypothetical protein K2P94_09240 [Rhodospirillaceae bacterium]|nr:hypothetical protein [Rhodospirillaceae bacterium]